MRKQDSNGQVMRAGCQSAGISQEQLEVENKNYLLIDYSYKLYWAKVMSINL
jgi:hypothetical protein